MDRHQSDGLRRTEQQTADYARRREFTRQWSHRPLAMGRALPSLRTLKPSIASPHHHRRAAASFSLTMGRALPSLCTLSSPLLPPPPSAADVLTEEEAREHICIYTPVSLDVRLPEWWTRNIVHVTVAPRLTSQARLDYIEMCRGKMMVELRDNPWCAPDTPYWDEQAEVQYQGAAD